MTINEKYNSIDNIAFHLTPEHDCSYLDDRQAVTLFVDPEYKISMQQYSQLAKIGFRRSGAHVYRPHCSNCGLCIPVRVNVHDFIPNRSQRRNLKANEKISYVVTDASYQDEHFDLYRRYMKGRHAGGGMDNDEPENYEGLIKADWSTSKLLEFRLDKKLLMIAVVDCLDDSVSAVYTFFDPEFSSKGLGIFGVLTEMSFVKSIGLDWLYLGYWNPKSQKMAYKSNYQPMEFFDGHAWSLLKAKA